MTIFEKNSALNQLWIKFANEISSKESLDQVKISHFIDQGIMVLLGNPNHTEIYPIIIGQPSRIKINANLGTSPLCNCFEAEKEKIEAVKKSEADTIMDLSIAGDLDSIRIEMLKMWKKPLGTVPMYAVGQKIIESGRDIASMTKDELFSEIEKQAGQGVDFITVHCGLTRRGAELAVNGNRKMGIVSRGGSMLARWMLVNRQENPLLEYFDELLEICLPYNVTLSLGDGLRPGAGVDAGDAAQWEEVINLGELALRARKKGVQAMIEGPGHMALNMIKGQIQAIKELTHQAPLYVLGPLCCDSAPGYDHIAGAIGGALAVEAGADFLCYLTPAEHLTLPTKEDVFEGVMASRIAAHIGEISLKRPWAIAREQNMNAARKNLDWHAMGKAALNSEELSRRRAPHSKEEVCAMCGKFCAVKMLDMTL